MSWKPEADEIAQRHRHAEALGGEESVRRHREGGKLTVRERIAQLTDPGSFQEVGKLAGQGSYTPDGVLQSVRPMPYVMGLAKIDGRQVKTPAGPVTLQTKGATAKPIEVGWRDRFLALITDPNVAYILLMLGMLGLFFELANPGVILPGVIGGISLILAFFAFQTLPINWAGLLLILFGIVLLLAEIKIVSHGVLTIGGVIAILLGSVMLVNTPELPVRVSCCDMPGS